MLDRMEILDPRWSRPLAPQKLTDALEGGAIERLAGGASTWCGALAEDVHLAQHLRMTGAVLCEPDPEPRTRACGCSGRPCAPRSGVRPRARSKARALVIVDPRRFGTGELLLGGEALEAFFAARLGAGAVRRAVHARAPARARARASAPIKALLLDQRRIAGVGNIYADEALFRARIHPLRPAGRLSREQYARLREAVIAVLRGASTRAGRGSTTSVTSTACAAPSRTGSSSTGARASRARDAAGRSSRWSWPGAAPTCARACQPRPAPASTAPELSGQVRPPATSGHTAWTAGSSWRPRSATGLDARLGGRLELGEPAEQLAVDDHLGEGHHAGPLGQLRPSLGVLGQVDLGELDATGAAAAP